MENKFQSSKTQKTPLAPVHVSFGDPPRAGVAQLRSLAAPFSGYEEEERFGAFWSSSTLWVSLCLSLGKMCVAPPRTLRAEVPGACPVRPVWRGYRPAQVPRQSQPHAQRQCLRQLLHRQNPNPAQPSPAHPLIHHHDIHPRTVPVPAPVPVAVPVPSQCQKPLCSRYCSLILHNRPQGLLRRRRLPPSPNPEPSPEARNLSDAETETSRTHAMAADAANQPVQTRQPFSSCFSSPPSFSVPFSGAGGFPSLSAAVLVHLSWNP